MELLYLTLEQRRHARFDFLTSLRQPDSLSQPVDQRVLTSRLLEPIEVVEAFRSAVETAGARATVTRVGMLGLCYAEPLVDILRPGNSRLILRNVNAGDVPKILDDYLVNGVVPHGAAIGYLGDTPIDGVPNLNEVPGIGLQQRIALRNSGHIAPDDIYQYIANGGYAALHNALNDLSPSDTLDLVNASGLRGRGGAGFPTGMGMGNNTGC